MVKPKKSTTEDTAEETPVLFEHTLCKPHVNSLLRELRDQLAHAGREEVTAAETFIAILPRV